MTRPEDIPADVWDEYRSILSCNFKLPIPGPEMLILACRAALAYGQSRADEATERAARVCEEGAIEADKHMENAIFDNSKRNYASAHVTCKRLADAIRSQK